MPITENFSIPKEEGTKFEVLPADIYQAELVDVNVEENPDYNDKSKIVKNFSFLFSILEEPNRGRWMTYRFVPTSLYIGKKGKNKLYNVVETLIGHELTLEEEATMDTNFINLLVGKQIRLGIKVKTEGEKKTNIIETLYPVKTSLESFKDEEVEKMRSDYFDAQKKWKENKHVESIKQDVEEFMTEHQGDNMEELPTINLDEDKQ